MSRIPVGAPGEGQHAVLAVFESLDQAVAAVPSLAAAGVDPATISVAGREDPLDALNTSPEGRGTRAERLAGALDGFPAITVHLPGVGPVAVGGWLAAQLPAERSGTADEAPPHLVFRGRHNERLEDHHEDLNADRCLIAVHGNAAAVVLAAATLRDTDAERVETYEPIG